MVPYGFLGKADMPGYMLTAYQNESEQRWAAAREAAAEAAHEEWTSSATYVKPPLSWKP